MGVLGQYSNCPGCGHQIRLLIDDNELMTGALESNTWNLYSGVTTLGAGGHMWKAGLVVGDACPGEHTVWLDDLFIAPATSPDPSVTFVLSESIDACN